MKTLASDLFDALSREGPEHKRKFIHHPAQLEHLVDLYDDYSLTYAPLLLNKLPSVPNEDIQDWYDFVVMRDDKKLRNELEISGISHFLNALIKHSADKKVSLKIDRKLRGLGEQFGMGNARELDIYGNPGWFVGREMGEGIIRVHGNAGYIGESMHGGTIEVRGNVQQAGFCVEGGTIMVRGRAREAGFHSEGGNITIDGYVANVGEQMQNGTITVKRAGVVGKFMEGGAIHILESYHEIDRSCKGNVYFKNKLIRGEQ